jgi:hypothetical protein
MDRLADQGMTDQYKYDLIAGDQVASNNYLYCGQQYDSNVGLYYIYLMIFMVAICAACGQAFIKPIDPDDPKGLKLPRGVPRMIDTNGTVVWIDPRFTTEEYNEAARRLLLREAERVAAQLNLTNDLPITSSNIVAVFISPFGFNYINGTIGTVTTSNYCYCVSQDSKFCYLLGTHQPDDCGRYRKLYTWAMSRIDTNQAYQLATQWLGDVSMDVNALNRDCRVTVELEKYYGDAPPGKFVPIYFVSWTSKDTAVGKASVRVFTPTKSLLQLCVEDPKYILRRPLEFTNLDSLFPGTGRVWTLPPARPGPLPGD